MTWASSLWPLPATPAMPRISPERTSSETPRKAGSSLSFSAWTSRTERTTGPGRNGVRSRTSSTSRPTISRARSDLVAPAAGSPAAVTLPRRMTVTRSAMASTSASLWLMKTMERPLAVIVRSVLKSSSTSCGASTAVGSSMIRTLAPR